MIEYKFNRGSESGFQQPLDEVLSVNQVAKVIELYPRVIYEIPQNAEQVGKAIYDLGWPRRKIVDRFQLRLEYYLDAGGVYRDHDGEIFSINKDSIEKTFGDDPGYKWLSEYPKRCEKKDLKQAPSGLIQLRLQILDLALRTPPLGFAI